MALIYKNPEVTAICQKINSAVKQGQWQLSALSHLVVGLDVAQLHHELEAQQVIGADGLQLQQFAQRYQLWPLQMFQRQFVLKEFRELHNVFSPGLFPSVPHL